MAADATADDQLARVLAQHYDWHKPTFSERRQGFAMHYFFHRRWRGRYILSRVGKYPDRIPFALQFHIMELLRKRGFRQVRMPVARPSGTLWAETDDHYWFVRKYTPHNDKPDWSGSRLIENAARTLARMHRAGTPAAMAVSIDVSGLAPYYWTVERVLSDPESLEQEMWRLRRPDGLIGIVERTLKELGRDRGHISTVPLGITHQDFRPNNLLTRDEKVVEVVDWDLGHVDNQLYDAVIAAIHVATYGLAHGSADLGRGTRFLDAYIESCGYSVSKEARQWMVRYTVARNLALSGTPGKWIPLQGLAVGESARVGV